MLTIKLIEQLQKMVDDHKSYEEVMGPHEIMIDVFTKDPLSHLFRYSGFSSNIKIDKSDDGVYDILSAFAEEK